MLETRSLKAVLNKLWTDEKLHLEIQPAGPVGGMTTVHTVPYGSVGFVDLEVAAAASTNAPVRAVDAHLRRVTAHVQQELSRQWRVPPPTPKTADSTAAVTTVTTPAGRGRHQGDSDPRDANGRGRRVAAGCWRPSATRRRPSTRAG